MTSEMGLTALPAKNQPDITTMNTNKRNKPMRITEFGIEKRIKMTREYSKIIDTTS